MQTNGGIIPKNTFRNSNCPGLTSVDVGSDFDDKGGEDFLSMRTIIVPDDVLSQSDPAFEFQQELRRRISSSVDDVDQIRNLSRIDGQI